MTVSQIPCKTVANGVRLTLHLQPGAKRDAVAGLHGNAIKIALKAPPVDGKANAALKKFLAKLCHVPVSAVVIEFGELSRDKVVTVVSDSPEELKNTLIETIENG